jgi:hypothetical protein
MFAVESSGKIGRCCRHCYDGENARPEYCSCLCHEGAKLADEGS